MAPKEYIAEINRRLKEIKHLELELTNFRQEYKRNCAFMEGDRVKLTRKDEENDFEIFLIVSSVSVDKITSQFHYKFKHITPTGKQAHWHCNVYYRPNTDKIEKIA